MEKTNTKSNQLGPGNGVPNRDFVSKIGFYSIQVKIKSEVIIFQMGLGKLIIR